ncbi:MAG: hypothetical protein ACRCUS_04815, partial [Anaerovoracaceae bacterium]
DFSRPDAEDFIKTLWHFIIDGKYRNYYSKENKHYYRFDKPKNTDFPAQIELFSKRRINFEDFNSGELCQLLSRMM